MGGLIHVGAWDGREYLDDYSGRRLLLFEPQARPFLDLMQNLGGRPGVTLVNAAAGATFGRATIYRVEPDHSSSLLDPARLRPDFRRDGQEDVRMTTVDGEVEHFKLTGRFEVLRIDTQGYELEVLHGAEGTLHDLRRIEIEYHDPETYPGAATVEDVEAFLGERRFARHVLSHQGDDLADGVYERTA